MSSIVRHVFEGAEVRAVIGPDGEPRFVAADVCRVLDIGNVSDAVRRLDDDERGLDSIDTPNGCQFMTLVTESGLYSLVMGSRKPEAKRFKRWVTSEVLPAIRKTGSYGQQDALAALNDPATLRALLGDYAGRVQALEAGAAAAAPKLEVYDRIVASGDTVGFREAAKLVRAATGASEPEVRALMVRRGWVQRLGSRLSPAHTGETRGYVTTRACEWTDAAGATHVKPELRITPKGVARAIAVILATEALDTRHTFHVQ